jgi:iron(III) transport system permease protein
VGSKEQQMISCEVLEKPGWWREISLSAIIFLSLGPALPLLWVAVTEVSSPLTGGFGLAIWRSFVVATAVTLISLLAGIPAGLLSGLYDFPGRRILLALLAIPLLVPSFLWAIGLSQVRIALGFPAGGPLLGATSAVFAFLAPSVPLVTYMTLVSARRLSKGQVDAVRLVGGERLLFFYAARAVLPGALLAALLAGILTLSDPGPGQILGYSGIAYEILVSFSASYDFALAAQQCAVLTGLVLMVAVPVAIFIAPRVAAEILAKEINPAPLAKNANASWIAVGVLSCIVLLTTALPLTGIVRPLFGEFPAARAFGEISRTIRGTLIYALTAGVIATAIGIWMALAAGREKRLRRLALIGIFLVLSLPPSLNALGMIELGTVAPAWLDPLLRSRFTVGLALALRFLPVAAVLGMRSFGSTSPSRCLVGAVHGVTLSLFLRRVLGPAMLPAAVTACMVIALEATAEVGTVLLLRPPGADSIPVQIFTVMANAPEALVAALCFFYVAGAALLLMLGWILAARI